MQTTYVVRDVNCTGTVKIRELCPAHLTHREPGEPSLACNIDVEPATLAHMVDSITRLCERLMCLADEPHLFVPIDLIRTNGTVYAVVRPLAATPLLAFQRMRPEPLNAHWLVSRKLPDFDALPLIHHTGIVHVGISPSTLAFDEADERLRLRIRVVSPR